MQLIQYANRPAALVTERRVTFVGGLEDLPDGHPLLRFVVYMALYARDVVTGELPGAYTDEDAERFARACLIDPDELAAHADEDDARLAERLRIPVEQVAHARAELDSPRA
jgi:hypothetical protein